MIYVLFSLQEVCSKTKLLCVIIILRLAIDSCYSAFILQLIKCNCEQISFLHVEYVHSFCQHLIAYGSIKVSTIKEIFKTTTNEHALNQTVHSLLACKRNKIKYIC
jgi:hypothetical protein